MRTSPITILLATLTFALGCGDAGTETYEDFGSEEILPVKAAIEAAPIHHIDLDPRDATIETGSAIVLTAIPRDANNFFVPFTGDIAWEIVEGRGSLVQDGLFVKYFAPASPGLARVKVRIGGLEAVSTVTVVAQPSSTPRFEWNVGSCTDFFAQSVRLDSDPSRNVVTFRNQTGDDRIIDKVIGWVGKMPDTHRPAELKSQVVSERFVVRAYPGVAEFSIPSGMGTWQNNQWRSTISYDTWRCEKKVFGVCVLPKFVTRSYATDSRFTQAFVYFRKVGNFDDVYKCSFDGFILP